MESNGKSVDRDGQPVDYADRPDRLGRARHQRPACLLPAHPPGHEAHPLRLPRGRASHTPYRDHHRKLLANCLAQGEALMRGKTEAEARAELKKQGLAGEALEALVPHKVFPGNRPSSTLLYEQLTPCRLGIADRALRAQDLHPGHRLEHQQLRPMGRGAGQAAGGTDPGRARGFRARRRRTTPRPNALIAWCRERRAVRRAAPAVRPAWIHTHICVEKSER